MLQYCLTWLQAHGIGNREEGQDFAEYALLLGVIAVILVITIGLFRDAIVGVFQAVIGVLNTTPAT